MPFDPLYLETPGLPALSRELGVPDGVAVHIWRPPREWWEARDRRIDPYQVMFLVTVGPETEAEGPRTWTPGTEPYYVWLARIRYGEDIVQGEVRWSAAEGVYCQVRYPDTLEGEVLEIGQDQVNRAHRGVQLLREVLSERGRPPDSVLYPYEAMEFKDRVIQAIRRQLDVGTPLQEITRELIAPLVPLVRTLRTFERRLQTYGLAWEALKREAFEHYLASQRSLRLPKALVERLEAVAQQQDIPPNQLAAEFLWQALREPGPDSTPR